MTGERRRSTFRTVGIIGVLAVLGLYGYLQAYDLIRGPVIEITSPAEYERVDEDHIILEGIAMNVSHITINDAPIFISPDGVFRERLPLAGRYTTIRIYAEDRFGRDTAVEHTVTRTSEFTKLPSPDELHALREGEDPEEDGETEEEEENDDESEADE